MLDPNLRAAPQAAPLFPNSANFCTIDLRKRLKGSPAQETRHAEFLAYMSHEMRTPLTAILGFTQALKMSKEVPAFDIDADEYVEHIDVSAQHLLVLVQTMLSYLQDACDVEAADAP